MSSLINIKERITILERRLFILEGAEDKEKLRKYLGDDLYNAYMSIRNKIPSEADLLKQYPKYSLAELDDSDEKFKDFSKKYDKLRKSNIITTLGESILDKTQSAADKNDLYKSYNDYMDMRDFAIETFDKLRSFEKIRKLSTKLVQKFVSSYVSVGDLKAKAKEGADLIYSDSKWDVYKVKTYDASKYYGKGTKWCISGNYEGHASRGEFYFNDYINRKNLDGGYYFYISKSNPNEKYCLLQGRDGKPLSIWNAADNELEIKYDIEDLELPKVKGINLHDYRIDAFINLIGNEDIEGIKEFLKNCDRDIDLNGRDTVGDTAIVVATETGNIQIVKTLLEAGLDPNVQSSTGYTALLVAMLDDEYAIEELLLKNGADPDKLIEKNSDLRTVLYIAVVNALGGAANIEKNKSIELLLKYNANPNIPNENGHKTPLFVAAKKGRLDTVKLLIENGADDRILDSNGDSPLDIAIKNNHEDVVNYLTHIR